MSQLRFGLESVARPRPPADVLVRLTSWPARGLSLARLRLSIAAWLAAVAATGWIVVFGWLAIARHLAAGSHAEDLGFTDQVIWNFLRGQFFRMSLYQGATWNTEIDLAH